MLGKASAVAIGGGHQTDTGTAFLEVRAVSKAFGGVQAVRAVSFSLKEGEFFALLGPSGCGKTTLLRMLAGFETPDSGSIVLDGVDIAGTPPYARPVNMMFQSYALFPHLSVADNIAFGLRRAGMAKADLTARVEEMVALARLGGLEQRRPDQLSGGQKQRVALARALARRPRLLLLDEPLGALDKKLREETQAELKEIQHRLGLTFLVVTHDQDEAMILADRIAVMNSGVLVQTAGPREIYNRPRTRFVAEFIGDTNILEVAIHHEGGSGWITVPGFGARPIAPAVGGAAAEGRYFAALRPERIAIGSKAHELPSGMVTSSASLESIVFRGDTTLVIVLLPDGRRLRCLLAGHAGDPVADLAPGASIRVGFVPDDLHLMERQP